MKVPKPAGDIPTKHALCFSKKNMHCIQAPTIFQLLEELHNFGCSV
jgi:hypothetical protein